MSNQQVFAHDDDDVGAAYRRIHQPQFDKVKSHITDLFHKGIIKSSQSEFVGPIVTCRKKNGKISVCVDSRRLNTKTRKDAFPLPRVDEIFVFDHLAGAKNFSTVDLESAYNQVEIDEANTRPRSRHPWVCMSTVLCISPAIFQRLMHILIREEMNDNGLFFLDDINIYSSTIEEHFDVWSLFSSDWHLTV